MVGSREALSRRERQIMDAVYRLGEASVADVRAEIADPPSYSAVRALMRVLTDKGHLTYSAHGPRYIYRATVPREEAQATALDRIVRTFFGGSTSRAVAALMDRSAAELTAEELDELEEMIQDARREGR